MKRFSPLIILAALAAAAVAILNRDTEIPPPPESWTPVDPS